MRTIGMLCVLVFISAACAKVQTPEPKNGGDVRTREFTNNVRIGDLLAERGRFLEAGFYYEAALFFADDEAQILPKLIAAQVKSDRLRAARSNVGRLIALRGRTPALARLAALLDSYAPIIENTALQGEVLP